MNAHSRRLTDHSPSSFLGGQVSLGRHILDSGLIAPWQLFYALACQRTWDATLTEIFRAKGWLSEEQTVTLLAGYYSARPIDLCDSPASNELMDLLPASVCLKFNCIAWQKIGSIPIIVTGRPERLEELRALYPHVLQDAVMAVASERSVNAEIEHMHRAELTGLAETRVDSDLSCRGRDKPGYLARTLLLLAFLALVSFLAFAAQVALSALTGVAFASMFAVSAMKVSAVFAGLRRTDPVSSDGPLPRISVLVPLYREREIASALVARLAKLTYPKALLDVHLVLEENDSLTEAAIQRSTLPGWMKVVKVPEGTGLKTKPRALNYALDFCRGEIIGIWDAEDAPAPDQLEIVARHFANAPPETACLQGILDFYNPYTNWISRCFTIEYATWFRTVLPGNGRLGFAIPLGGTTLFIRRSVIEELGCWDAHNVTEDADLGIRLARFGYRTELIPTVTHEEANCRAVPWIKQRSRWLKGYMLTYLVHMRRPRTLWREIGGRAFLGVQLVFACSLLQFVLAPLIWLFWCGVFGFAVPVAQAFPPEFIPGLALLLLSVGLIDALIAFKSIRGQGREALIPWIFCMPLYFLLATLAAYKALYELVVQSYYWDKTSHGKTEDQ